MIHALQREVEFVSPVSRVAAIHQNNVFPHARQERMRPFSRYFVLAAKAQGRPAEIVVNAARWIPAGWPCAFAICNLDERYTLSSTTGVVFPACSVMRVRLASNSAGLAPLAVSGCTLLNSTENDAGVTVATA